ncbi:MAG TPA: hypothetical protein VH393_09630 [Ktedonobacterales bacterium]|jgi:hypothetical protein
MARLAPIETRNQGQTIPMLTSRGALANSLRQARAYIALRRARILLAFVSLQTLLLLISLTPQTTWANLRLPNGPIPTLLTPLAAALFYALPAVTGALCRRWYTAITLATLPAWVALGVFATLAAPRLGFAYLTQDTHAAGVIGTLELFAGMGLLGWIMRLAAKDGLARLEGSR